jgi:hypothetical protein
LCGSPAASADPCHEEITGRPVPNPNDAACHQAFIVTSTGYGGQVFLVDLLSGERRLISDSSDPDNPGNQGVPFGYPSGIAMEPPSPSFPLGSILIADSAPYSGSTGAINIRVDPTSGNRSLVTEWTALAGWPPGAGAVAPGSPTAVGDWNGNGIIDRMVKFDRATVQSWFAATGEQTVRVKGRLIDGRQFTGDDIILVTGVR